MRSRARNIQRLRLVVVQARYAVVAKRLRQDSETRFGAVTRISRQVCTEVARFG